MIDVRARYDWLAERIPDLSARATRTSNMLRRSQAALEQSRRLLGHRHSDAEVEKTLRQAEQAVLTGRGQIARQLAAMEHLERHNLDATETRHLLENMIDIQIEAEAHAERLRAKLKEQTEGMFEPAS
jgi:Na+/phosphate symporter